MRSLHFMRGFIGPCVMAVCLAVVPGRAAAQPRAPEASSSSLTIFVRGAAIGTELVNMSRSADGWTITSTGRLGAPIDSVARQIEVRYTSTWQPREFTFDGVVRGYAETVRTVIEGNQAKTDLTIAGQATQRTEPIDPNAVLILPNTFFG